MSRYERLRRVHICRDEPQPEISAGHRDNRMINDQPPVKAAEASSRLLGNARGQADHRSSSAVGSACTTAMSERVMSRPAAITGVINELDQPRSARLISTASSSGAGERRHYERYCLPRRGRRMSIAVCSAIQVAAGWLKFRRRWSAMVIGVTRCRGRSCLFWRPLPSGVMRCYGWPVDERHSAPFSVAASSNAGLPGCCGRSRAPACRSVSACLHLKAASASGFQQISGPGRQPVRRPQPPRRPSRNLQANFAARTATGRRPRPSANAERAAGIHFGVADDGSAAVWLAVLPISATGRNSASGERRVLLRARTYPVEHEIAVRGWLRQ